MGRYFNPPSALPGAGRRLEGNDYKQLVGQLQDGEELIGHYDRGLFQNAPWLFSEEEFGVFESQVHQGVIWRIGFYALPESVFKELVH